MEICHRREFLKLIFYAKYQGLTLEMSAFSLRWPIYIINLVDEKKLSCDTPPPTPIDAASQMLVKLTPLIHSLYN